jgi:hypothetical protein
MELLGLGEIWTRLPAALRWILTLVVLGLAAWIFVGTGARVWAWPVAFLGVILLMATLVQE